MVALTACVSIAVPRTLLACTSLVRRYESAMHADLRQLGVAQQVYRQSRGHYAITLDSLGLTLSPGVRLVIDSADTDKWSASATHEQLTRNSCRIRGHVDASGQVVLEDPACDIPPGHASHRIYQSALLILLALTLVAAFTSPREPSMRKARRALFYLLLLSPLASLRQTHCRSDPHPAVMLSLVVVGGLILLLGVRGRRSGAQAMH